MRSDTQEQAPSATGRARPSRRALAKGTLWAAPTAVAAVASPAYAASCSQAVPDIGFGTFTDVSNTSAWQMLAVPAGAFPTTHPSYNANKVPGFRQNEPLNGASGGPWFGVGNEPSAAVTVTAQRRTGVALEPGCSYCVSLRASTFEGSLVGVTVTLVLGSDTILTMTTRTGTVTNEGGRDRVDALVTGGPFQVSSAAVQALSLRIAFPRCRPERLGRQ